jgi:hypothetical protein
MGGCTVKTTIWFPDEKTGLQFEVEFDVDKEIYRNGINIESIRYAESADFTEHFSGEAIEAVEKLVLKNFEGCEINQGGQLIKFAA